MKCIVYHCYINCLGITTYQHRIEIQIIKGYEEKWRNGKLTEKEFSKLKQEQISKRGKEVLSYRKSNIIILNSPVSEDTKQKNPAKSDISIDQFDATLTSKKDNTIPHDQFHLSLTLLDNLQILQTTHQKTTAREEEAEI